jgi:thiol:disulfide interchange protein
MTRIAARITALIVLSLLITSIPLSAQTTAQVPSAESLISAALKTAKAENKAVMLEFRADWCQWCRRLDVALNSPELSKLFMDHYVVVKLTVQESEDKILWETPGAEKILEEVGAAKAGIPMVVFLDKDGKRTANTLAMPDGGNIGYPVTAEEIQAFGGLLEKTAPRMTAAQRTTILDWLKKHDPRIQ